MLGSPVPAPCFFEVSRARWAGLGDPGAPPRQWRRGLFFVSSRSSAADRLICSLTPKFLVRRKDFLARWVESRSAGQLAVNRTVTGTFCCPLRVSQRTVPLT